MCYESCKYIIYIYIYILYSHIGKISNILGPKIVANNNNNNNNKHIVVSDGVRI